MAKRFVIKITGAAGQGIKTSGIVLAKALKKSGFCTFGYTEYPSLIRGGHNVFQIDISPEKFASISNKLHILLALDQNSIKLHAHEIEEGGVMIFDEGTCTVSPELTTELQNKKIEVFPLNLLNLAQSVGGTGIMKNTVTLGAVWAVLGLDVAILDSIITQFFNKSAEILALNIKCSKAGFDAIKTATTHCDTEPDLTKGFADDIIISGNEAIALGAIAGGVRLYSSYPMTPASSILSYLAIAGTKKGMVVKQAEDEITAANMVIGASYAGTRAMCGTSGGGFDLMTEALSLAAMTETPFVVVLGQRPGPATGVPTWTAQGDLNIALYSGHGEFPRIVMAMGDVDEAFNLTIEAHNLAERFQAPVVLLTDKYLAESFFSTPEFNTKDIKIERGKLINETAETQPSKMRYETTADGVSDRWLPGQHINTYLANSDEHTAKGYSTEDGKEIATMLDKRHLKVKTITDYLPNPEIIGSSPAEADLLIISWGSNKQTIIDAQNALSAEGKKIAFMNIQYINPLKTEFIANAISQSKKTVIIEVNQTGQLANHIEAQTRLKLENRILKYDGRPFYFEELLNSIKNYLA